MTPPDPHVRVHATSTFIDMSSSVFATNTIKQHIFTHNSVEKGTSELSFRVDRRRPNQRGGATLRAAVIRAKLDFIMLNFQFQAY